MIPKCTNCRHISSEHVEKRESSRKHPLNLVPIIDATAGPLGEIEEEPKELHDPADSTDPHEIYTPKHLCCEGIKVVATLD